MAVYHRPLKPVPTVVDGIRYDSRAEARRAEVLELARRGGQIRWWLRQVPVYLGCAENKFKLDFVVCEADGSVHGEEIKGCITREWRRVRRLWVAHGPFALHLIHGETLEV